MMEVTDSICLRKGIQTDVPTHVGGGQISATNPLEQYTVHTETLKRFAPLTTLGQLLAFNLGK